MRRALDALYDAAAYAAALFMVGVLLMVLASVAGRLLGFNLRGSDAYAGYSMAAAAFLALAHTLKRGEHIRVGLFLERFGPKVSRALELWSHGAGSFFCVVLAIFSVRLVLQSHEFNDVSQGNDATPLWIPQLAMAAGAVVLAVAMLDDFVLHLRGRHPKASRAVKDELKLME
ncbi:MAG TPA: TRAP transporter small permease [Usitatibacteraceae bacterium]|mgnify:CR=1 FL=1|nr:TRAP transporter small permease [Usitatibacteraceae bacterium]